MVLFFVWGGLEKLVVGTRLSVPTANWVQTPFLGASRLRIQNRGTDVDNSRQQVEPPPKPVQRKIVQDFLKNGEGGEYFSPVFVRECDLKTDEIRDRKTERESQRENQAQRWWQPLVLCGSALQ
jgi:hypothetical protein